MANYKLSFTGKEIDEKLKTMVTSWNDLEDKPFYDTRVVYDEPIKLFSDTVNAPFVEWDYYKIADEINFDIMKVNAIKINFMNVETYVNVKIDTTYGVHDLIGTGDLEGTYIGLYIESQEKADIFWNESDSEGDNPFTKGLYINMPGVNSGETLEIAYELYSNTDGELKILDEKYYLTNLPCYDAGYEYGKVICDVTFTDEIFQEYSDGTYYLGADDQPSRGEAGFSTEWIEAIIDDTTYVVKTFSNYYTAIGSLNLTPYPFIMHDNGSTIQMTFTKPVHSVKLTQITSRMLKQLDEKFIPDSIPRVYDLEELSTHIVQPDWNINYELDDSFIKNRTHYRKIINSDLIFAEKTVSTVGTSTYINGVHCYTNMTCFEGKFTLDINKVYSVYWNREAYVLSPKKINDYTYIGNSKYLSSSYDNSDTGPFVIAVNNKGEIFLRSNSFGERLVSIYVGDYVYYQLDEKYIPDTIARSADVEELRSMIVELQETIASLTNQQ